MRYLILALMLFVATGASAAQRSEDFVVFLRHFRDDAQFRRARVAFPLKVKTGNSCEDGVRTVAWSRDDFARGFTVPLTLEELEAHVLSQKITEVSASEVRLFQFRDEADSYLIAYVFNQSHGRWFLEKYEDVSC